MNRMITACAVLLLLTVCIQADTSGIRSDMSVTCKTCHSCDVPTGKDVCLKDCPRAGIITIDHSPEEGPDVLVMSKMSDKYGPVVFSHQAHARMSEMSGGCAVCHHYNRWSPIMGCNSCHETERKREDLSKPDLKAAFHRQCMECHRGWSHSTECGSCHSLKSGTQDAGQGKVMREAGKKAYPDVQEPKKLLFTTECDIGQTVTFYHNEHTGIFGLKCVECHKQETCVKCHDQGKNSDSVKKVRSGTKEPHGTCASCHEDDSCEKCHNKQETGPFDHDERAKFIMDKTHKEVSCEDCHADRKFSAKPSCGSCHDDKDTLVDTPGMRVSEELQ